MKSLFLIAVVVGRLAVAGMCASVAGYLVIHDKTGWGWFLFAALWLGCVTASESSNSASGGTGTGEGEGA